MVSKVTGPDDRQQVGPCSSPIYFDNLSRIFTSNALTQLKGHNCGCGNQLLYIFSRSNQWID